MRLFAGTAAIAIIAAASPARAGEQVLYQPAPDWVEVADISAALDKREDLILYDRQVALEDGVVTRYTDLAYDISTTQAMQRFGTLQFAWMPDKGDLTIHRLAIIRGDETIDLLAEGVKPEVIRREQQLEKRTVDGQLTAMISVPRLQVGDVLRVSATTTARDQALDGEMQVSEGFIARPARVGFGRLRVLWPEDTQINWGTLGQLEKPEPETRDGYRVVEFSMPIAEPKKMPEDAPRRFLVNPLVQVGSFADWQDVSSTMAPHFGTEGTVAPGGPIAQQIARIEQATSDPVKRMALALQVVQDEISYLANGMDGGNYLPQSPADTWQLRYGDCKAKSLLLLAMLREMDIDGEVVLVHSTQGDVASISQPVPGAFDHMIVRASIDGTDYWLDGTSAGTRHDTVYEVPNFGWALPLTEPGSDLTPMTQRWQKVPDRIYRTTFDFRNGVDFPALYEIEIEARGVAGAQFRQLASETSERTLIGRAMTYLESLVGGLTYDAAYTYDEASGVGTLRAKGMTFDNFKYDRGISTYAMDGASIGWSFETDRARSLWRDIPYRLDGPYYSAEQAQFLLPEGQERIELTGTRSLDEEAGGRRFKRTLVLDGSTVRLDDSIAYIAAEIAPADIPAQRTAIARIGSGDPQIRLHGARRFWELSDSEIAKRIEPYIAAGSKLIAVSEDAAPIHALNANFYRFGRQYEKALAEYDRAIDTTASAETYAERANIHYILGDIDAAQADAQAAFDLQGDLATASMLASYMARNGEANEALDMLDDLGLSGDEKLDMEIMWSEYSGHADRQGEAWNRLEAMLDERPNESAVFNALCWHAAIWNNNVDDAEAYCDRAVDLSGQSAATVDSRALVYYRQGRMDEALKDLEMALEKAPDQAASLFLRGLIRKRQGDAKAGALDLTHARRLDPRIDDRYEAYGLTAA